MFTVEDDGIGREEAAKRSSNTKQMHQSLGLTVTSERIKALSNGDPNTPSKLEIHDLVNSDGKADGTAVIIDLKVTL